MRIKKHKNGNEYLFVSDHVWVRNFTNSAPAVDINSFTSNTDRNILIDNQSKNELMGLLNFDGEGLFHPNVCIVSDGYQFKEKRHLLNELPSNVLILGTNRSLRYWDVKGRRMDYYIVNNPYEQCLSYLPDGHHYYPSLISSVRTCPDFVKRYRSPNKLKYYPTFEERFSQPCHEARFHIDDYRNPICAAISIAYRLKAIKILLFCCDDVFEDKRSGAEQLDNGLWMYPQHRLVNQLVDGCMYWLLHQPYKKINVGTHSSGPKCEYVPYIKNIKEFFESEF